MGRLNSRPEELVKDGVLQYPLRKLPRFQLRTMLNYMKASSSSNISKEEMIKRMGELATKDSARANSAWKSIILAELGTGDGDDEIAMDEDRIRDMITEQLAGVAQADVKKAVDAALSKLDLNSYRRVEVVTDGKVKKMKDILPEEFDQILSLCGQRVNTMLIGPTGCGKTFVAGKVAEALDLKFASISCSEGLSESAFLGWLLPVGKGGNFEHVPTSFLKLYENGGLFLVDEGDNADANTFTVLNQALANDGFYVPQRHSNPYVKRHKDFVCIMSANTFGTGADAMYVGRNQLDAATLDRYCAGRVLMDYSAKVEEYLIHPEVLKWGRSIRAKIRQHRLRRVMSTRIMLDLTKMTKAAKWGRPQWEKSYFIGWTKDELDIIQR